jgi:hypothetical protein
VGEHVNAVPAGVVSLADHEAHARGRLDASAWAYFSGGAGDESTLREGTRAKKNQPRTVGFLNSGGAGATAQTHGLRGWE